MTIPLAIAQLWPPLVALALLLGGLELVLRRTTLLASFESSLGHRLASLDGLRAFLAMGVVICHVGTFYYVYRGMAWGPHPNPYYRQAGAASVRIFFMITGFLFWSKAMAGGGKLAPWRLYRNRLYRIMPLYLALVASLVVLALANSGFRLVQPSGEILGQIAWLIVPGIRTVGEINGYEYTEFVRQAWTLKWEVAYYAVLPALAFAARSLVSFVLLSLVLVALTVVGQRLTPESPDLSITLNFLVGMAVAHLRELRSFGAWPVSKAASAIVVAIVALAPIVTEKVSPYLGNLLYAGMFALVVLGNDVFGLLRARSSRVLGEVSYSVYLLHMVVLVLFYRGAARQTDLANLSHEAFWALSILPVVATVLLSLVTFRFVERWGIARSHRRPPAEASA